MAKKKEDRGYAVALVGARGLVTILIYALVAVLIIFLARTSYQFGYAIFNESGMEAPPGRNVTLSFEADMDILDIAEELYDARLIENRYVFAVQERLSRYHNKLTGGTFVLNTTQTPTEIMAILSQENTEGQPDNSAFALPEDES